MVVVGGLSVGACFGHLLAQICALHLNQQHLRFEHLAFRPVLQYVVVLVIESLLLFFTTIFAAR